MSDTVTNPAEQDPFLFDSEQLHAIADGPIIRDGLGDFKENRVTMLDGDVDRLLAEVEDADYGDTLTAILRYDGDGNLCAQCDCRDSAQGICRHAVAALYAWSARQDADSELLNAVDTAIGERIKRGRSEVRVEALSGEPWFGTWRAQSIDPAAHFPRSYQVNIRSLQRRANYCTCPDFATNQLGTCKHIEAVLHQVAKHADYELFGKQSAPHPYLFLDWEAENAPQIRLHRVEEVEQSVAWLLDRFFDPAGFFSGRLPDDYYRFMDAVADRHDIDLGADVTGYVRQLAAVAAHRLRATEIREQIKSSSGRLPGVRARLYPYQVEGVAFLAASGRALLADDMGLGKTLQAIAAAGWLMRHAEAAKVLVVCPASLKQQWEREIDKFTGLPTQVVQGSPEARGVQYRQGNGFFIINYELILRDLSVINEVLSPDLIILDEAQRIKNWRTKIATAVKRIPSRYAFVLSGTPLENRLEDLYSLLQVVDSRILGPLWRYMVDFHVTDERDKVLGYRNLSELRRRLAPVMLRRDRRLVRDQLPDRIETQLDIALTNAQQELHDSALANAGRLATIAKRRPLTPTERNRLMAALQQARMACNAAGLVDKETQGSPKLDELESLLDELCVQSGLKAVVFSQWALMTELVEQRLRNKGIGYVRLHGGVPTAKRGELMDRFREDDAVQVFISTDAGGTGLNLQSASVLVNLDVPWNPAILDQRIARVHRLGQTKTVQVILMVASDAYEGHVMTLVKGKRDLFDNVIDPDASEDVVGVSKKLLETLVDDLATATTGKLDGQVPADQNEEIPEQPVDVPARPSRSAEDEALDEELRQLIVALQQAFGMQIERILGAGGGVLVVMDQVDEQMDELARELGGEIPVALIDPRTLNALRRLGSASPVAETQTLYDAEESGAVEQEPRLLILAREKLDAAGLLLQQDCAGPALELLLSALLAGAAALAGEATVIAPQYAAIWLYDKALPAAAVSPDQATLILRAIALVQSPEVPEAMVLALRAEVELFLQ